MKLLCADQVCEVFDLVSKLRSLPPLSLIIFFNFILSVNKELNVFIPLLIFKDLENLWKVL